MTDAGSWQQIICLAPQHIVLPEQAECRLFGYGIKNRLGQILTIKGPSRNGGLSRYEFEKEITRDEGLSLLSLCEPGIVEKVRWLVRVGKHVFEVDEFLGENAGLVVAEVELGSEDEDFERPDFLGEEVTGDRKYYNSSLRAFPFSQWK